MKKIINLIGLAMLIFFVSCEEDTENISFETNYATFEMTGDNPLIVPIGTFTEPGIKAMAGEEEIEVNISSDLDKDKVGIYTITYSATNPDGFGASTSRTVIVYDPEAPDTDLPGIYTSNVVRTEADGSNPRPFNELTVTLTKFLPGIYYVSDFLGGYYDQGANYGSVYAMTGYITVNTDNSLRLLSSYVAGWGDGLENFYNASYDPLAGSITWKSVYAGADIFTVTLNK